MTVWLDANPEILSEDSGVVSAEYLHMTEGQLNMVADALDFAIQPNIPTQADVDAQPAPPQEATQNGYTLEVKSVETDGHVAQILIGGVCLFLPTALRQPSARLILSTMVTERPTP